MQRRRFWTLWDADDTLLGVEIEGKVVGTGIAYTHVLDLFADAMEALGLDREEALHFQQEIDMDLCRKHGFGDKARFPQSLRATYELLSSRAGQRENVTDADEIEQIGYKVFDFPYRPLPGATETLATVAAHYNVAIVTKGEDAEQRKKVFDTGLFVYADQVLVLGHKDHKEWEQVLDSLRIDLPTRIRSWAIGNSVKSDINPPLELGLNGIHLDAESGTWGFEVAEYENPLYGRELHRITDIRDVLKHVPLFKSP